MLRLTAVTLYKHGLGFFERAGRIDGEATLLFPRRAMDDVLKSLTVVPAAGTTVKGIAFETPEDRNEAARRVPITFAEATPLSSLITAFTGYSVRVDASGRIVEGKLIGLEREDESHLKRATLAVLGIAGIELVPLANITSFRLSETQANEDLRFALANQRRDEERAGARVSLSQAAEATLSYIAPAPAWRVSYRVLIGAAQGDPDAREVFVQGWGLFDNTLEEDLDQVRLTLTAGMPVSFRYELHQPNTPERAVVRDEERTISEPIEFFGGDRDDLIVGGIGNDMMSMSIAPVAARKLQMVSSADVEAAAPVQAGGESRGALFAYTIDAPVSVKRGESGMVPIVAFKSRGARTLMYNRDKHPDHPAASVRFKAADTATLERGPAIVLDGGHYGGEAVVPFTIAGSEVILAYALELGVRVSSASAERLVTVGVGFRDRSIFIDSRMTLTTTYEVVATLAAPANLVVEHQRRGDMAFDTKPIEEAHGLGRFKLTVPARGKAKLTVTEFRMVQRTQDVTGLTGQAIQEYLENKLLDADTVTALQSILGQEAQLSQLVDGRKRIEEQRRAARARLDDARKSLGAVSEHDTTLRQRFLDQLTTHDDALQSLDLREGELDLAIAGLKAEIDTAARALAIVGET